MDLACVIRITSILFISSTIQLPGAAPKVQVSSLPVPAEGKTGFKSLSPNTTGLIPSGSYKTDKNTFIRETANSGLAAGDVNGDGLPDLFVCGMETANGLYINQGNWKFKDVAKEAGVACRGWRLSGAVFADVEGDGDLDLIATSLLDGRNFMFLNNGSGKFTENLNVNWVYNRRGGTVAADLADVDGDGDLDMYTTGFNRILVGEELGREGVQKIRNAGMEAIIQGRELPRKFLEHFEISIDAKGEPQIDHTYMEDHLYLNDGKGGFKPVSDRERRFVDHLGRAMKRPRDPSYEGLFRDVDGDGDPDLYVTSDFRQPDRLWLNNGSGRFRAAPLIALRRTSQFSMGFDYSDINRDGHLDFLTADMLSRSHKRRKTQMGDMQITESAIGLIENRPQIMQNTLQLNRGDGTWAEIAQLAGVQASEWSWGVIFTDVDLDGYEDLIVATGMTRDFMDADATAKAEKSGAPATETGLSNALRSLKGFNFPKLATQNVAFRNKGNLKFEYKSDDWGFSEKAVSGGIAEADFDGDGDLDLIINNWTSPLEVYRNESVAPRIAVRLVGHGTNTGAIGAKVRLLGGPGGPAPMQHEMHIGGGFASGSENLAVFGTGTRTNNLQLEIIWRHKNILHRTLIPDLQPNHAYTITEPETFEPYAAPAPEAVATLFENADERLHIPSENANGGISRLLHQESAFDDFAYQSLLPNRLSQLGPGVAWVDLNSDGREDLAVSSGRGGKLMLHLGTAKDTPFTNQLGPDTALDHAGLIAWHPKPGQLVLSVGQSNYEQPDRQFDQPAAALSLTLGDSLQSFPLVPGRASTTGPMTSADIDGDGDLDLFVGGRTVPARYPEPADSLLLLNDEGILRPDPVNAKLMQKLGLISGAVFGDLDGDGDPDLILACEWGPIKVLRNESGTFTDATKALGLDIHKGWWNSVTLGDFNGDGRLDLAAGNWGHNSKYEGSYSRKDPLRIAYADFDDNGVLDIVEYHRDKITGKLVPERGRSCSTHAMPFIGERNLTYEAFGSATLDEVYGESLKKGTVLEANTLSHTVFLNRGDTFEAKTLPVEAQFAPVFGINAADFDGDGNEDLFIAQNFFASQRETPRSDGGRGLILRGDGRGAFTSMPATQSGIRIYGEQRGSAVGDYNQDGRPDLAVAQNGARTRLFRNVEGQPGLRIRLNGGPANPTGVGAIARLIFADNQKGHAKIVTAGSGYWSQDSATLILARPVGAVQIQVQWPHGKTTTSTVPPNATEIQVQPNGDLKNLK